MSDAEDRVRLLFCRFVGAGFVVYLGIALPWIVESHHRFAPWWTPVAMILIYVPGIALGAFSFAPGPRDVRLRAAAALTAGGYLVATLLGLLAWRGPLYPHDIPWWPSLFPGVAAMAAVVVCRFFAGLVYLAAATACAQGVPTVMRVPGATAPVYAEASFAFTFCLAFVASAYVALRTGRLIDEATRQSHSAAATAAAAAARTVERERFDGLIHDGVMSTLLSAARLGATEEVSRQAGLALRQFDRLEFGGVEEDELDADATLAELRNAATAADQRVRFVVEGRGGSYPGGVVRTVAAAAGEAVRNSSRHAPDSICTVTSSLSADALTVTISDDGPGFDPHAVPPHRLGIAVSIQGRMRQLRGGGRGDSLRTRPRHAGGVAMGESLTPGGRGDVRDLLGMTSQLARWAVVPLYVVTYVLSIVANRAQVAVWWTPWVALVILTAAAAVIVYVDGDPLDLRSACFVAAAGPAALICVVIGETYPVVWGRILWPLGGAVLVNVYLVLRGRVLAGWLGAAGNSAIATVWAAVTADQPIGGFVATMTDYAPILMATFCALTVRPAAATIFALRERSSDEIAREAAARAALEERDAQLRRLDRLARPLLRRIEEGGDLTDEERSACALLEAQLRDSLRARVLVDDRVNAAVRSARSAGAEVVLLDDGAGEEVGEPLRAALLGHLAETHGGRVIARVLPPGRAAAMTVLVTGMFGDPEETERYEYDAAGALVGPGADEGRGS